LQTNLGLSSTLHDWQNRQKVSNDEFLLRARDIIYHLFYLISSSLSSHTLDIHATNTQKAFDFNAEISQTTLHDTPVDSVQPTKREFSQLAENEPPVETAFVSTPSITPSVLIAPSSDLLVSINSPVQTANDSQGTPSASGETQALDSSAQIIANIPSQSNDAAQLTSTANPVQQTVTHFDFSISASSPVITNGILCIDNMMFGRIVSQFFDWSIIRDSFVFNAYCSSSCC
jgi:hypothetical protein